MKRVANSMIGLLTLACLSALAASVYPGVLNDLLFAAIMLSFLVVPIVGVALIVGWILLARWNQLPSGPWPLRKLAIAAAIVFATLILLTFDVPCRLAFAISRAPFERLVQNAPGSWDHMNPLNLRLGLYKVDAYAADERGGVYFRVYTGFDGIGPDRMSYGFVHQPNSEGTPFGAAHYEVNPLSGDWYWFQASDDWY